MAVGRNLPYSDIVITTSSSQASPSSGFEMDGVDGGVLVMPIDD